MYKLYVLGFNELVPFMCQGLWSMHTELFLCLSFTTAFRERWYFFYFLDEIAPDQIG